MRLRCPFVWPLLVSRALRVLILERVYLVWRSLLLRHDDDLHRRRLRRLERRGVSAATGSCGGVSSLTEMYTVSTTSSRHCGMQHGMHMHGQKRTPSRHTASQPSGLRRLPTTRCSTSTGPTSCGGTGAPMAVPPWWCTYCVASTRRDGRARRGKGVCVRRSSHVPQTSLDKHDSQRGKAFKGAPRAWCDGRSAGTGTGAGWVTPPPSTVALVAAGSPLSVAAASVLSCAMNLERCATSEGRKRARKCDVA